jgi:hypothetical protein
MKSPVIVVGGRVSPASDNFKHKEKGPAKAGPFHLQYV